MAYTSPEIWIMELCVALPLLCSKLVMGFIKDAFKVAVLFDCEFDTTVPSISHNAF